jgi:mxaA protein
MIVAYTRSPIWAQRAGILISLVGAIFVAVTPPVRGAQFDNGWASVPGARAEQEQSIRPGWAIVPGPDSRIRLFEPHGPRAFGLLTGDRVRHRLLIKAKKPYQLQRSSLPPSHWVNAWLELQEVNVRETREEQVNRYVIALNYQIFATPRAVTLDAIPGFDLTFSGGQERFKLKVPDWAFSISPLLKPEAEVDSIAEIPLRADAPPPLVDVSLPRYGVAIFGILSTALAVSLLYLNSMWPFARGGSPFARACRELRALRRQRLELSSIRDGFRIVHQAFNQTAGEVVFAEQLQRFFAAHPAFSEHRAEVEAFFVRSRQIFFGN